VLPKTGRTEGALWRKGGGGGKEGGAPGTAKVTQRFVAIVWQAGAVMLRFSVLCLFVGNLYRDVTLVWLRESEQQATRMIWKDEEREQECREQK
jgi:hypothetical protein